MKVFVTGLIGGFVFFVWGMLAHTVLPIGNMGMKTPTDQQAVLDAIAPTTQGEGVYMYPSLSMEQYQDEAAAKAFAESSKGKAYAFVIYQPGGNPVNVDMVPNLLKQLGSDLLSAWIVAFVLALGAFGFSKRVFIATALGLFSWLTVSVPWWNWYLFPLDFTVGSLLEQVIGWAVAGSAMAWWLGRK